MKKWFQTWNRPEYQEWAIKVSNGYLLVVIRKEKTKYLCVKAELIMKSKGLPDFKVLEEEYFKTKREALKQIQEWKLVIPNNP
ncbi:MAG: hypothetical protein AAB675_00225 [Patescibacteria group bacterium]|mgnify:CR=1 FL=1